jgi:hypothetical protein
MLDVVLYGPRGPQPTGRPLRIEVRVRNLGGTDAWITGVLDGSEDGIRYPAYRPLVTYKGAIVAQPGPPEDPLVGPLRTADFRRLAPGEEFDPTGTGYLPLATFANFTPSRSGVHRYTLTLSTKSARAEDWLGRFGQDAERAEVLALVAKVPQCTVTAAPLDVEIR